MRTVLQISAGSAPVTADLGRRFLAGLGLDLGGSAADPGITNGRIPRVYGRQASEYVIRRAISQIGVPYSWGGGNANGPSRGIDGGADTVGFDCSGLMLYAFAGVGNLGNGMMLEAPFTGSQVRVAPVRTSGMTPYVTRLIEY